MRLIPYCERNYNLIELGPKGTGKSHIYSEFSPHGILLSGGEVTVPKLFVNNSNGKLGLVGYWDAIAFDEFAGKQKKPDKKLVDIMKNYMANKSFSRGVETLSAEASMICLMSCPENITILHFSIASISTSPVGKLTSFGRRCFPMDTDLWSIIWRKSCERSAMMTVPVTTKSFSHLILPSLRATETVS